jgi:hypothetical protein
MRLGGWLVSFAVPAFASEAPPPTAASQLLAATSFTASAERAARLTEDAAQKVADAVRAERRAIWLTRTAQAMRRRDGRDYLAAQRGAELARLDREVKTKDARTAVSDAVSALDALSEMPPDLLDSDISSEGRELQRASNRLIEAAIGVKDAALPVRESLLEVNAVRVRLELSKGKTSEDRSARIEEAVARRRLAVSDAVDRLVRAAERLQYAGEGLRDAGAVQAVPAKQRRESRFGGLGAGLGIGFTVDVGGRSRVDTAQIVDVADASGNVTGQVVRVNKANNDIPHVMLEGHYLFTNESVLRMPWCGSRACLDAEAEGTPCWLCNGGIEPRRIGAGPFVGLQPGEDFIDAVGGGLMLGVRADALRDGDGFQLGVGYFADPNTRVLGDGFSENQPPPAGETQVRYKDVTKSGIMVLMSYGF